MKLGDYKVRTKMLLLGLLVIGAMTGICIEFISSMNKLSRTSLDQIEAVMVENYDEEIKKQVDNAISMLDAVYAKYEEGEYTLEEAQVLGADLLREMHYGDGGYFWADTYEGDNVVFLGSETEGTNRMEEKDANGFQMIKEIIRGGKEPDGGYTDYYFPKAGSTEPLPKRSYSRAFEPFGWVIGTGNYIDDINAALDETQKEQKANTTESLTKLFAVTAVVVGVGTLFPPVISRENIKGLKTALAYNEGLGSGDFTGTFSGSFLSRKGGFWMFSKVMDQMKRNL